MHGKCSSVKKNESLTNATTWMKLKHMIVLKCDTVPCAYSIYTKFRHR